MIRLDGKLVSWQISRLDEEFNPAASELNKWENYNYYALNINWNQWNISQFFHDFVSLLKELSNLVYKMIQKKKMLSIFLCNLKMLFRMYYLMKKWVLKLNNFYKIDRKWNYQLQFIEQLIFCLIRLIQKN